jgi:hypothetical protein
MTMDERVNLLHEEVGKLAHGKSPPEGRETAIRRLKAHVEVLRREQYGLGTRPIHEGLRAALTLGGIGLLIGMVRPLVAAARGHPPQAQQLVTFASHLVIAWGAVTLCCFVMLGWERWRETWAVREAIRYTDALHQQLYSSEHSEHGGPMSPGTRHGRRSVDVVFGLFLASGVTVGTYCLWAVADWIHPQGERGFGLYIIGAFSFVPALLAWLAGGAHMFMASRDRDVRFGVALTTAHLMWWLLLIGLALRHDNRLSGWVLRTGTMVEPGLYAVGVTFLAARWFCWRRHGPVQVAA